MIYDRFPGGPPAKRLDPHLFWQHHGATASRRTPRAGHGLLRMKLLNYSTAVVVLAALSLAGAGCQTHKTVQPLGGGYEEVTHPHHTLLDDPPPPRIALQYRDKDDKLTRVWPSLYSTDEVVKDDLALFVAEKAEPDRVTYPRLFAVRAPAPPLDITDELLWRWCKANGKSFEKALTQITLVTPVEEGDGLQIRFQFWANDIYGKPREDWPDNGELHLSWKQVDDLMRAVKAKGVQMKDLRWHTVFIGEKF